LRRGGPGPGKVKRTTDLLREDRTKKPHSGKNSQRKKYTSTKNKHPRKRPDAKAVKSRRGIGGKISLNSLERKKEDPQQTKQKAPVPKGGRENCRNWSRTIALLTAGPMIAAPIKTRRQSRRGGRKPERNDHAEKRSGSKKKAEYLGKSLWTKSFAQEKSCFATVGNLGSVKPQKRWVKI